MDDAKPEWDEDLGARLLGALVLVGITREGSDGTTEEQFFGTVEKADAQGIELRLGGARAGNRYRLPPDPRAFFPARPGSYHLRSTGEVLENPDFTAIWTIGITRIDGPGRDTPQKHEERMMAGIKATPFIMFQGEGRQALDFYAATFPGATVEGLEVYGPGEQSPEGTVKSAILTVGGQRLRVFDSPPVHAFTFTPAISFFIDCESEEQLRDLAAALGEGGGFMMPIGNYGFSQLFCWLADRFGVSWQLNLP